MKIQLLYFLERVLLVPCLPFLYFSGKKARGKIKKLPPQSDYQYIPSLSKENTLLIIGESTVAGVGASSPQTTFASNIDLLSFNGFEIHNIGKNGLRAGKLMGLLMGNPAAKEMPFTSAIVMIGANDCFKLTHPKKFRKDLEMFLQFLIMEKGVKKIIIPMVPPVHVFPAIPGLLRFFMRIHRYMLTSEITSLSQKIIPLHFDVSKQDFTGEFFAADGIHPSDLGYSMMAESVFAHFNFIEKKKEAAKPPL
ncbi:SGNH/GDSL hydrolase family protein [Rhodonellum sp.]|uniref:SGNH/GDSL hydrolase family protein n=1 Tax=Rhodonellum sp. TaxID=2231180 RepID=UPI0027189DDA|nr:SGNH/GDSL hydrolase family protein [Rhodonellum sp.]MDO9554747.1 SGNH/GDSL hydrolase family protein [Rhodonellum sp.]